jgi:hypothetical protein
MSLKFTIVPITSDFASFAYDIQTKIKDNVELEITTNIDTNYKASLHLFTFQMPIFIINK